MSSKDNRKKGADIETDVEMKDKRRKNAGGEPTSRRKAPDPGGRSTPMT